VALCWKISELYEVEETQKCEPNVITFELVAGEDRFYFVGLAQQLAFLEQEALHSVFIDLKKAYDAMDRERCLEILEGYGVGPNMLRLLEHFWDVTMLAC